MPILRRSGDVTFLRVHELHGGFGPPNNHIDTEAVAQISSESDHFFGTTLRTDQHLPSHEGMVNLLRDGLVHADVLTTTVDYRLEENRTTGIVIRVELRRR